MWDVGGQKSLRSYWRNYFECTDGLVWVVDSADRMRMEACRDELNVLLQEERLAGATLLILANKQDLPGALSAQEIKDVSLYLMKLNLIDFKCFILAIWNIDSRFGLDNYPSLECGWRQCGYRFQTTVVGRLDAGRHCKAYFYIRIK